MALPTGTFSDADRSGRLQVVFCGRWLVNDADWGSGAWDLVLRAYVGSGPTRQTALLSLSNATATIEVDYTAGTSVAVGIEDVSHAFGGAGTICAKDLRIACHLLEPSVSPPVVTFAGMLARLAAAMGPLAATPQTPRWEPDTDGAHWYVRPLSALATHTATADRWTAEDPAAPGTGFCNHPLAEDRTPDPIDPASVTAIGYASNDWTGPGQAMTTEVRVDKTTQPGTNLFYIRAANGPLYYDPIAEKLKGTCRIDWRYADIATLDGTTYATAWPGLAAIDWAQIQPGDTLWVCGSYEDETLTVGASGAAGAYIKIRFDHATDPGRIDQGRRLPGPWTAYGNEWTTPVVDVSTCMLYADDARMAGLNTRSRARMKISAVDTVNYTIAFANIRRLLTGAPIWFPSDQVWAESLPAGIERNRTYYLIVQSSNWAFYSVTAAQYVCQLADSYADAIAGTAIPFGAQPNPARNLLAVVVQTDYPFYDPQPGSLQPGQYAVDIPNQVLHCRPAAGSPAGMIMRLAAESYSAIGACVYGVGRSYIKILGGGEYGGLFGVPPRGRLGLCHQNCVEFDASAHIVVDGLHLQGARSAVTYIDTSYGTVRNCRILDLAHHASGGEDLQGSQEPYLLLERNWISDIGLQHEFGDAQALVTNPDCHNATFRRNYVQRLGLNRKVTNPTGAVFDASANIVCWRNWFDGCHGKTANLAAGANEPAAVSGARVVGNVVTRIGEGFDPTANLVQRTGGFHVILNGTTDPGVYDAQVYANLIAWAVIGDRAPDTLDDCGLVYLRTNNAHTGRCEARFECNAVLGVDGPVLARQHNPSASVAPWLTSDQNLYAAVPEFAIHTAGGTILQTWTGAQITGDAPGAWTADTGQDRNSTLAVQHPTDQARDPTPAELEYLRAWDAYDTPTPPALADIVGFPLD